jgi:hypothetical protein
LTHRVDHVAFPGMGKLALGTALLLAAAGCGGPQEQGDQGATCFRDDECALGLVCAAVGNGERTCTSNVTGLVSTYMPEMPPAEPPAGGASTGGAANGGTTAGGSDAGGAVGAGGTEPSTGGSGASAGGSPSGAGAPSTGGTPSGAGAPSTGGSPAEPAGGAPAEAGASG